MRALRILLPALLVSGLLGCANVDGKLEDVTWGNTFESEYDVAVTRARQQVLKHFQNGFDPDKTNEEAGDFWTVWHYDVSIWYRGTTRKKAHVKVERAGKDKVRVGISIVQQINENIDNPHDTGPDARWVSTSRDSETEELLQRAIARRYLAVKPSEYYETEHAPKDEKKGMREDLINRSRDVDLESEKDDKGFLDKED